MCTSIAMNWGGGCFGRNMDVEHSFGEQVAVTPRRYPLQFWRQPAQEEHFALIGMAHLAGGRPLSAEAANEKGLYMAGWDLPGRARDGAGPPAGRGRGGPPPTWGRGGRRRGLAGGKNIRR